VAIDAAAATVVVGSKEELLRKTLHATRVNWVAGAPPDGPVTAVAQIRYRHAAAAATIEPLGDDRAMVVFDVPQSAVTPGQAVVFYDGDAVVGGGWIDDDGQSLRE
jgi:tRNA-uridine 2-sulfurtransferase